MDSTDKMLQEIVSYKYKSHGFSHVFLNYSQRSGKWDIVWRNPVDFENENLEGDSPNQACTNALDFIKKYPKFFKRRL